MKTLVLLGVGSTYFTKGIVESTIVKGGKWDIRMVDIDENCLDIAMNLGHKLVEKYDADIKISGSTKREEMLTGADAIVSTIGVGGRKAWEQDIYIFRDFNIYQATGDTYGAGGISRALRTIPEMLKIAADIEKYCPDALLVNFTNPMSVCCWALNKYSKVKTIGLCYGVTWIQHSLAKLIDVPFEETWSKAIGLNHFTWITDFTVNGKNAWPQVRKADKKPHGSYTWDLFEVFGAFPTVGDGHICEFVPGYQAKGAYNGKTFGVDAANNFTDYAKHWDDVFQDMADQAYGRKPLVEIEYNKSAETFHDEDLFIDILSAFMGDGPPVERTINLPNHGIVAGLPQDAILEVTTLVNSSGFHPYSYGSLPPGLNAIIQRIVAAQALTVEAAVSGDYNMVLQALMADLTALTKERAQQIADAILKTHKDYLPNFFK